ncbi:hypothetical protein LCGC14_2008310 [marine sediment metagenome]|uniref:Uncharacterized protein n=1 Tax=marine sediment metagenome TaxID=412755 RepID=A0A0F9F110_9ZZZZ
MRWRCTNKSEYGETGYSCQFVGMPEETRTSATISGQITVSADGPDAVPLVPIKVRGQYDELPVFGATPSAELPALADGE